MAKHMEGCPKSFSYVQHFLKKIYTYIHINVNIQILHTCHIVVLMYVEVKKMSANIYIHINVYIQILHTCHIVVLMYVEVRKMSVGSI